MPIPPSPTDEVWRPGRHFEVLEVLPPTNHPEEAASSLLLRIWREGLVYDLRAQPFVSNRRTSGWALLTTLPESCYTVPVLHTYCAEEPVLDQTQSTREPGQCLFLVQPVEGVPVPAFLAKHQQLYPSSPFGLSWRWVGLLLRGMLLCLQFLQQEHVIHGSLRLENFLLQDDPSAQLEPRVRITGFHQSWCVVKGGRKVAWSSAADIDETPVGGRGSYRAPEVHRAYDALFSREAYCITPAEALPKAELWTVGRCMYDLLCPGYRDTIFERMPLLKDHVYAQQDLPPLPADAPGWLCHVVKGLVRSDDRERLNLEDALQLLELGTTQGDRAILTVVEKQIKIPVPVDRVIEKVIEVPVYMERIIEKPVERVVEKVVEVIVEMPHPPRTPTTPRSPALGMAPKIEKIIEVQEVQKIVEVEKLVHVPYIMEVVTRMATNGEAPGYFLTPKNAGSQPFCPIECRDIVAEYRQATSQSSAAPQLDFTPPCSPKTTYMRSPPRSLLVTTPPSRQGTAYPTSTSPSPRRCNSFSQDTRSSDLEAPKVTVRRARTKKLPSRAPSQERNANGTASSRDKRTTQGTSESLNSSARDSSNRGSFERTTPRQQKSRNATNELRTPSSTHGSFSDFTSPRTSSPRVPGPSPRNLHLPPNVLDNHADPKPRDDRRPLWTSGVAVPMDVDQLDSQRGPQTIDADTAGRTGTHGMESARATYLSHYLDSYFSEKGRSTLTRTVVLEPEQPRRAATPPLAYLPNSQGSRRTSPTLSRLPSSVERPRRSPQRRAARSYDDRGRTKSPSAFSSSSREQKTRCRPGESGRKRGTSPEKFL